jgi:hypothetical protein
MAGLSDLRATEDPQDQAVIAVAEAFTAPPAASPLPRSAVRTALGHAAALGISHEFLRWAWPLAARAACDLADTATTTGLLAMLDGYRPGQLAPMLRAERDLTRARLASADGSPDAGAALTAAITRLRQHSTPYPLARGLLDHAQHLLRTGDHEGRRRGDRRSPQHRRPAGLPATARPRRHHPPRQPSRHDLTRPQARAYCRSRRDHQEADG